MGTRILAVRLGLVAKIAALDLKAEHQVIPRVSLGYPSNAVEREKIWTQRARFTQEPASLRAGTTARNEVGRFELCVEVEGVGQDQEWTTGRAVALGEALEDLVATHAEWPATTGLNAITVEGDGELQEAFNDQGTLARLVLPIKYTARITTEE